MRKYGEVSTRRDGVTALGHKLQLAGELFEKLPEMSTESLDKA
ncbi:MAG: hypothetical protein QMC90_01800 [Dehalococcoidales bacterium]|nr:hypothetical protein [Dehalococcoidales bacterium]